jgi:hypothetical protein
MVSTLGSMIDKANLVLLASPVPVAVLQGATLTDLGERTAVHRRPTDYGAMPTTVRYG